MANGTSPLWGHIMTEILQTHNIHFMIKRNNGLFLCRQKHTVTDFAGKNYCSNWFRDLPSTLSPKSRIFFLLEWVVAKGAAFVWTAVGRRSIYCCQYHVKAPTSRSFNLYSQTSKTVYYRQGHPTSLFARIHPGTSWSWNNQLISLFRAISTVGDKFLSVPPSQQKRAKFQTVRIKPTLTYNNLCHSPKFEPVYIVPMRSIPTKKNVLSKTQIFSTFSWWNHYIYFSQPADIPLRSTLTLNRVGTLYSKYGKRILELLLLPV